MSLSIINSMFLQNNSFICLSKLVHLLAHVDAENEMKCEVKGMKQSADSACVVIPTMLLQISEEPLLHPVVTLVMYWTYHGLTRYVQWSAPLSFVRFTIFFLLSFSFRWLKFATLQHLLLVSTDKTVRSWELDLQTVSLFFHTTTLVGL